MNFNIEILYNLKDIKYNIFIGFCCGIISSYIVSYIPILYTDIIKILIKNDITKDDNNILQNYIYMYLLYKYSSNIFAAIRGYIFTIYCFLINIKIKKKVIESLFNKDLNYYAENKNSEIIDIVANDSAKYADLYTLIINIFFRNISHFFIITYILYNKSYKLYILCLIFSLIQFSIAHYYNIYFYDNSVNSTNEIINKFNNLITDYVNKIETYRSLGLEYNTYNKLNNYCNILNNLKNKEGYYYGISLFIRNCIDGSVICLLIICGLNLNISNKIIYEFTIYVYEFINIFNELINIKKDITCKKKSINKINDLISYNKIDLWGNFMYSNIFNFIPNIKIKNISFAYSENNNILTNFNLDILPYEIIGISGKSGSGKSTMLKLLLGLYNCDNGSILIDNIPIKNFDKNYFYNNIISYVGQEPVLFDTNIDDNIIIDYDNYDIELFNYIKSLIEDIKITDNNINLSGGEKQRIAICRAFMKKTKILLLDEPTSALDEDNEKKVLELINDLHKKYKITIIIVSHKKSTLNICNKIVKIN
tara:strand:- start:1915 stop:3525 length:1611 start_codon:yes stop_codon:yes gene_type:complete